MKNRKGHKQGYERKLKKLLTIKAGGCTIKTIKEQGTEASPGRALKGPGQSPAGVKRKAI